MKFHEYLLVSVAEECAEVAQRATKALRFGLDEVQPGQTLTNKARLMDELEDLFIILELLQKNGYLPAELSSRNEEKKLAKVFKYMDFAEECGTLVQEVYRASGDCVCSTCGKEYRKHALGGPIASISGTEPYQFLHRLCDGRLVKL